MQCRLLAAIVVCLLVDRSESVYADRAPAVYTNSNYGFTIDSIPWVSVIVDPPQAPQHGFAVDLESGGRIWVDGSYDAALTGSPKAFLDSSGQTRGTAQTVVRTEALLHMPSARLRSTKDGRVRDMLVPFRNRRDEVAVVYTFGLDTDARHARSDEVEFKAIISHFKLLPLPG